MEALEGSSGISKKGGDNNQDAERLDKLREWER